MKLLFITAHKYLPQMAGGLQSSTDQLCRHLLARGHKVAVLAGLMPGGFLAFRSRLTMKIRQAFTGSKVSRDTGIGYPVWRSWHPWEAVTYVVRKERPDLVIVLTRESVRMALAAQTTGVPFLMHLQDVEFQHHGGSFRDLGPVSCVANSAFTAEAYRQAFGVNPAVIYPFIAPEKYTTATTRKNVTFINPVAEKGLELALMIAHACPDIPFSFVETWPLNKKQRRELAQQLLSLPNVTLLPPQKDMRKIYEKCKILLVPSVWQEAYGRVALEAQLCGIPVIASNRGGLPEAVGTGGILIDPDEPLEAWVSSVRKLWSSASYEEWVTAALAHARRPENTPAYKIDLWEKVLAAARGLPLSGVHSS